MPTAGRSEQPTTDETPPATGKPLDMRSAHLWQLQPIRDVLVIAAVAGTIYAGYAMRTVTVPLLVALALAYLFEPIVSWSSRRKYMNRPLAVGAILAVMLATLAITVATVVPLAVGQSLAFATSLRSGRFDGTISRLVDAVPVQYRDDVRGWANRVVHRDQSSEEASSTEPAKPASDETAESATPSVAPVEVAASAATTTQLDTATSAMSEVSLDNPLFSLVGAGASQVYAVALALLRFSLIAFLIPFYFYYFSVHWPAITGFLAQLIPHARRDSVLEILDEMDRAVAGFVRGRIVICAVMGAMFAIGWQMCGVPYGIALGLLTGALSIVPYLGGIGLPVALGLLVADQFTLEESARMSIIAMLLWPTAVFIVVQTIEGYLLTPIIAGKATNLDPVTIVVAILAGGSVAGVYGMLLAIPIAACGKIAAKRMLLPRVKAWARGDVADPLPLGGD